MNCPVCGEKTVVMSTRNDCESVHRRRKCKACGYLFFTEEYEVKDGTRFHELEQGLYEKWGRKTTRRV